MAIRPSQTLGNYAIELSKLNGGWVNSRSEEHTSELQSQ